MNNSSIKYKGRNFMKENYYKLWFNQSFIIIKYKIFKLKTKIIYFFKIFVLGIIRTWPGKKFISFNDLLL